MLRLRPSKITTSGGYRCTIRRRHETRVKRAQEQHQRNRGFYMNCLNHPETPAVAFCRTCGKPLCDACRRPAQGSVFCEEHAPAAQANAPPAPAAAYTAPATAPAVRDPNVSPALAFIL